MTTMSLRRECQIRQRWKLSETTKATTDLRRSTRHALPSFTAPLRLANQLWQQHNRLLNGNAMDVIATNCNVIWHKAGSQLYWIQYRRAPTKRWHKQIQLLQREVLFSVFSCLKSTDACRDSARPSDCQCTLKVIVHHCCWSDPPTCVFSCSFKTGSFLSV